MTSDDMDVLAAACLKPRGIAQLMVFVVFNGKNDVFFSLNHGIGMNRIQFWALYDA